MFYSYRYREEGDKYGDMKNQYSPGRCKLCGVRVLRLYDEGICLMCKINRTADNATSVFGRAGSSTKILKNKKFRR